MIKFEFEMGRDYKHPRFKEFAASGTLNSLLNEICLTVFCYTLILAKASKDEIEADNLDFMGIVRESILEYVEAADLIAHGMFDFNDKCREISAGMALFYETLEGRCVNIDTGEGQTPDSLFIDIGFREEYREAQGYQDEDE